MGELEPSTRRRWSVVPAIGLLVGLIWLVYRPVCTFGFVKWDDEKTLWKNPDFNPVSLAGVARYWREPHMDLWVPVTYTFWGLVALLGGRSADPVAYHAANVTLLCVGAVVVMLLLRDLTGSTAAALAGAALFAVHPVQVEPVGWSSGGKDLLSMLFSVLAVWQYCRWARRRPAGERGGWGRYALATVCFVLAMLAKPAAVTVPLIAALLHAGLLGGGWRAVVRGAGPWLLLAVPVVIVGKMVQPAHVATSIPLVQRPLVAGDALTFYFYKLVAPIWLTVDYGRTPESVVGSWWGKLTWIIPAAIGLWAWIVRRRWPWFGVSAGVLTAAVLPVLGLVRFDFQRYSTVGDHYLCLAMLGPAIALAYALRQWGGRRSIRVVVCLVLGALALRSFAQVWVWQDTRTLFEHALAINPTSLAANNVLAVEASAARRFDVAIPLFERAVQTRPTDSLTRYNFGNALLRAGDPAVAISHYAVALRTNPAHAPTRNNYGIALAQVGRTQEAMEQFQAAVRLEPRYAEAHMNIGLAHEQAGDTAAATTALTTALSLDPNLPAARRALDRIRQRNVDGGRD